MKYITTNEAAKKWGISHRRVNCLASEGRIDGAQFLGSSWIIPENAKKPADRRKQSQKEDSFRFPIYINKDACTLSQALSNDENQLRQAQIHFYKCHFDEAKSILLPLYQKANSRYVRIASLCHLSYIAIYQLNYGDFKKCQNSLKNEFAEDFPYKKEMDLFRNLYDMDFGYFGSTLKGLRLGAEDHYHSSVCDLIVVLSLLTLGNGDFSCFSALRYDAYEILCHRMELDGHFFEAQALHYSLLELYQIQSNDEMMYYHLKQGLQIAFDHGLYWRSAFKSFYYPAITRKVLKDFPADFSEMILSNGIKMHDRYIEFSRNSQIPSYCINLSDKEFILATYAVQGFTNKEIAKNMKVSEKTISKRYNTIYEKLGVKSKQELAQLVTKTQQNNETL